MSYLNQILLIINNQQFDAVAYINRVFPTEQSLSGVETAAARCEFRLASVQHDIQRLVREQATQRDAGQQALLEAQHCIGELALQVTIVVFNVTIFSRQVLVLWTDNLVKV